MSAARQKVCAGHTDLVRTAERAAASAESAEKSADQLGHEVREMCARIDASLLAEGHPLTLRRISDLEGSNRRHTDILEKLTVTTTATASEVTSMREAQAQAMDRRTKYTIALIGLGVPVLSGIGTVIAAYIK